MTGERSLAVVMPCYNEGDNLEVALTRLRSVRGVNEVIVVDASDSAHSKSVVERCKTIDNSNTNWRPQIHTLQKASRAAQMNHGASFAQSDILLFLHVDTCLPQSAAELVKQSLRELRAQKCWGRFDVELNGEQWLLRIVEKMMNWRSRITGVATGDQAMFVTRDAFNSVSGFPNIPIMEDVALSKRLKRIGKPVCIKAVATTSARRWQQSGVVRTIVFMWAMRLAYFLGVNPKTLSRYYRQVR